VRPGGGQKMVTWVKTGRSEGNTMSEGIGKERLLKVLSYRAGSVTEEGMLAKIDGEMVLRGDSGDELLAGMEERRLASLLMQTGHSGYFQ